MTRLTCAALAVALVACGGEPDDGGPSGSGAGGAGGSTSGCQAGETPLDDGSCRAAGVQPDGCAAGHAMVDGDCLEAGDPGNGCNAGELFSADGCIPAGVASCGAGFTSDANRGCEAVRPAAPCPDGQLALLGETTCRPVATCGAIAVEPNTVYVDQNSNGPQDGSVDNPYRTIQPAIDDAKDGAIVAIAAGSYVEDLVVSQKSVRLVGTCPDEVEIAGTSVAIQVLAGGDGSLLRNFAITSQDKGVVVRGASDVLAEQLWIHDTGGWGFEAFDEPPDATSVTLRDALVQRTQEQAVYISGSVATLERLVIRDTAPTPTHGWAVTVLEDETTFNAASATVDNVIIERASEVGMLIHAADVDISNMLIVDTQTNAQARFGRGLAIQALPANAAPSNVNLEGVVIEGAIDAGILVAASNATIRNTVVRDVAPNVDRNEHGNGIAAQQQLGQRSTLSLTSSLIDRASSHGVLASATDLTIEGLMVRDTQPVAGLLGRGASFQFDPPSGEPASATVVGSAIVDNTDVGILVHGATVHIEGSLISGTKVQPADSQHGYGIGAQYEPMALIAPELTVVGSVVDQNHLIGMFVGGGHNEIHRTRVTRTIPDPSISAFGRAINMQDDVMLGTITSMNIVGSTFEDNHEIAIALSGGTATLDGVLVRKTMAAPIGVGRSVNAQINEETGQTVDVTVRHSVFEDSHEAGFFIGGATLVLEGSVIGGTVADNEEFGDGLITLPIDHATTVTIRHSVISENARAGIANFGSFVSLEGSAVSCNQLDLTGQDLPGLPVLFEDLGGNACGCSDDLRCKLLSESLVPPSPVQLSDL